MRVLIVSHRMPGTSMGGVELVARWSADSLSAAGHGVTTLATDQLPLAVSAQLDVTNVAYGQALTMRGQYPGMLEEAVWRERAVLFARVLVESRADVVHVVHLHGHSPLYIEVARSLGRPVLLELHDFHFPCPRVHLKTINGTDCSGPERGWRCAGECFPPTEQGGLLQRFDAYKRALSSANHVIAPSRFLAEAIRRMMDDEVNIEVVPVGVGISLEAAEVSRSMLPRLRRTDDGLRVLALGAVTRHKGFDIAVRALAGMRSLKTSLSVYGGIADSDYAEELERAARDGGDGMTLELRGEYAQERLPAIIAAHDLLLVTSTVQETYSIVAREAAVCGLPVIAPRSGALPEFVVPGENGYLFEPGDVRDLQRALRTFAAALEAGTAPVGGLQHGSVETFAERMKRVEELLHGLHASATPATAIA